MRTTRLRGHVKAPGRTVVEGLEAVRYLAGLGHDDPHLLAYHPVARVNPYQALLYRQTWAHGVAPLPLLGFGDIDDLLPLLDLGITVTLHLHWTSSVLVGATTQSEAEASIAAFLARLDQFRAAGGTLVWTVHNVLPHDCRFPHLEARLQQEIVDRAVMVHVLSATTGEAVAEWFTLPPERTVHVPHPSYVGAYPSVVTRHEARYELGIEPDETTYLLFGALRPYKGLATLLTTFEDVAQRLPGPRRLLVAGEPGPQPQVEAFVSAARADSRVTLHEGRVSGGAVQLYVEAADVVVLPYEQSLNSGVLMLALSYGRPVIAPDVPGVTEIVDERVARLFVPQDPASLRAAWDAADDLVGAHADAAEQAALEVAARYDADALSDRFVTALVDATRAPGMLPAPPTPSALPTLPTPPAPPTPSAPPTPPRLSV